MVDTQQYRQRLVQLDHQIGARLQRELTLPANKCGRSVVMRPTRASRMKRRVKTSSKESGSGSESATPHSNAVEKPHVATKEIR